MNGITFRPIGVIRSPFAEVAGTPIQTVAGRGIAGVVEILPEYAAGLKDLEGFSHLILLYHLHLVRAPSLEVTPFLDVEPRGIFATRAPVRPNPIGLSVVRLQRVAGTTLHIEDLDVVDGTPLLDLKPYVPVFDSRETAQIGWFAERLGDVARQRADERFR